MAQQSNNAIHVVAALTIAVSFICAHEGTRLSSYADTGGKITVCNGETGLPLSTFTLAQCQQMTQSTVGKYMKEVVADIKVPVSPYQLAAMTSFAYNIGLWAYSNSQTLHLTNEGHPKEGCRAMMSWHYAGGKDCTVKANNCFGLVKRRMDERDLCLQGVK